MKVAVTGGTGFIGSHYVRAAALQGLEVVVVSRSRVNIPRLQGLDQVRIKPAGLESVAKLTEAFTGCSCVIHCAGINREWGEQTYQRVHIDGTQNVVEAARNACVTKIVLISFLRARPGCGSGYHESKWAAEEIIRGSGLDYTIIKEGITYGNGDHMISHLVWAARHFPVFGLVGLRPKSLRPVAVEDLVKILIAATVDNQLSGQTVAVVGPEEITLKKALKRVGEVAGAKTLTLPMPECLHYGLAAVCERVMSVPLISKAQVRILSEGLIEAAPPADLPPDDLAPKTRLERPQIEAALAPA